MDLPDSPTTRRALLGGIGTILAGGGVVYGASRLDSASSPPPDVPLYSSSETTGFGIDLQGHPVMGESNASVDVYYWSDYQCPFCRRFEENTLPDLIENHIETGSIRFVFIEYPYLGEASMTAAVMDRCVWRTVREEAPARYWEWHSAVFDAQSSANSEWASRSNLLDITRDVDGIDADAVDACMRERRDDIEASIEKDVQQARGYGIQGSPAFVIYNRQTNAAGQMVGAQPYERFDEAISKVRNA